MTTTPNYDTIESLYSEGQHGNEYNILGKVIATFEKETKISGRYRYSYSVEDDTNKINCVLFATKEPKGLKFGSVVDITGTYEIYQAQGQDTPYYSLKFKEDGLVILGEPPKTADELYNSTDYYEEKDLSKKEISGDDLHKISIVIELLRDSTKLLKEIK